MSTRACVHTRAHVHAYPVFLAFPILTLWKKCEEENLARTGRNCISGHSEERRARPEAGGSVGCVRASAMLTAPSLLSCPQDTARPDGAGGADTCAGAATSAGRLLLRPGGPPSAGRGAAGACLLHGLGPSLSDPVRQNQALLESHSISSVPLPKRAPHHLGDFGPGHRALPVRGRPGEV